MSAKLNVAFAKIRKAGILARQSFWCCQTCGSSAMDQRIDELAVKSKAPFGCCFYHRQDAAYKKEGEPFYLTYYTSNEDICTTEQIGRKIVHILNENGIETDWDGTSVQRIKIIKWDGYDIPIGGK